jgi:hypothetical protein
VTAVGLEPTANRLKVDCSTTELRGRIKQLTVLHSQQQTYYIMPVKISFSLSREAIAYLHPFKALLL